MIPPVCFGWTGTLEMHINLLSIDANSIHHFSDLAYRLHDSCFGAATFCAQHVGIVTRCGQLEIALRESALQLLDVILELANVRSFAHT